MHLPSFIFDLWYDAPKFITASYSKMTSSEPSVGSGKFTFASICSSSRCRDISTAIDDDIQRIAIDNEMAQGSLIPDVNF